MADNKDNKSTEKKSDKKPLNIKLILMSAFAVTQLSAVGAGLYMIYSSTMGWHAPKVTEEDLVKNFGREALDEKLAGAPLIYTFDKFTVNLSGQPQKLIQVEVNLEMLNKDGFEEIIDNDNQAKVKDRIIKLMGSKTFSDVETIQGKLFLKDAIAMEVNSILKEGIVKDVYFSNFIVQ